MSLDSYVTLGRSGLRVSPFTLGTMTFGDDHGWGADTAESRRILAAYLDRGGNSVDTANIYTNGHAEAILGEHFAGDPGSRERIVLGTKFFWNLHPGDPNGGGPGRKAVLRQLENSLRQLRTDYVDIYWLHNFDPVTPAEETLRTLDDLVTAGKVRYIGFSDVPAWATAEAATIARFRGWAPIVALQLEYSLLERTAEGELMPMAQAMGMGALPWGPLKGGFLSGKYSRTATAADNARGALAGVPTPEQHRVVDVVREVADELGGSPATVALSWLRGRPGVTSTLVGARRFAQFEANLAALELTLSTGHRARLDEISAPRLNFPAANNAALARVAQNGGTTVDGQPTPRSPLLGAASSAQSTVY